MLHLSVLMLVSCGHQTPPEPLASPEDTTPQRKNPLTEIAEFASSVSNRGAVLPSSDPGGDVAGSVRYLDQNWGPVETLWYYYADQGSRLIPRDTLVNLDLAGSTAPLASAETLTRYRYLLQAPTPNNPDGLPVGFA